MISIIIPTYNEARRLPNSLNQLSDFLKKYPEEVEVIIADDGSEDVTLQVAKGFEDKFANFRVLDLPHQGKGAAVREGFLAATGEIVLFTDADFSTPITEIDRLTSKITEGYDIAIGSRALDPSLVRHHQNFARETMGKTFNLLVQHLATPGLRDTQCGFKAFNRDTCPILFKKQVINGFAFDVELLFLARKHGLKVIEVPVLWFNDEASRVNPIKDTLVTLYEVFKIRFTHSKVEASLTDKFLYQFYKKKTFVKFVVVGLSATFVDFFGYFILTRLFNLNPLVANPISVETAIVWGFFFNNLWTWGKQEHQKNLLGRFLTYQFVTFGSLLFSQIQIFVYLHVLGIHDLFAKLITLPTVAIFNYTLHKRWTFRSVSQGKNSLIPLIGLILALLLLYLILQTRFGT